MAQFFKTISVRRGRVGGGGGCNKPPQSCGFLLFHANVSSYSVGYKKKISQLDEISAYLRSYGTKSQNDICSDLKDSCWVTSVFVLRE